MEILVLILSGGGVAMIIALVQAYRALKTGAKADERDHIEMLDDRRRSAENERDAAITVANYWRSRSGALEYLLVRSSGTDAVPEFPPEPRFTFDTGITASPIKEEPMKPDSIPTITLHERKAP